MAPAHHNLCGSVVEHQSLESDGLRFDSSWGLRVFPLSHACDKMKNIFLYVLIWSGEITFWSLICAIGFLFLQAINLYQYWLEQGYSRDCLKMAQHQGALFKQGGLFQKRGSFWRKGPQESGNQEGIWTYLYSLTSEEAQKGKEI